MTIKSELAPIVGRLREPHAWQALTVRGDVYYWHNTEAPREAADTISDLLEALEMVDAMFSSPGRINKSSVRNKVRAAIARARGETTDA